MDPYTFGRRLKQAADAVSAPKPPAQPTTLQNAAQLGSNMLGNSARVGGGTLSALAGGVGTVGTGIGAGLTNAWNAATPATMHTSPAWTQGINNAFNRSTELANAGVRDVYGGLGGDQNYHTQHSWDVLQRGLNSMPQNTTADRALSTAANIGAWGGHGAWNLAQAVPAGITAAKALPTALQYGRHLATTGRNLAQAAMAPVNFVKNTFRPGFGQLRNSLRNTARVYNAPNGLPATYRAKFPSERLLDTALDATGSPVVSPNTGAPSKITTPAFRRMQRQNVSGQARLFEAQRANAGGLYDHALNTATSTQPRGTPLGGQIMRHELAHGFQARTAQPNSLQGVIQSLNNSPGNWSQAAGRLLGEVNSNAAQARSLPQQIGNAYKFLTDPEKIRFYTNFYANHPFASQYATLHNAVPMAVEAGKGLAGLGGAALAARSVLPDSSAAPPVNP